ncbi:winged helix-turn-helix domain-containing protein [Halosimplex salinum]|uniref:winged helix-turn-helix domain-containing protein n=1 Tax=Halosimplex salinum TaxID=1710538 RepID=UPI000F4A509B|nr:winged helix-turn-helix domain-containing protein [Halosimplex salinum]
MSERADGDDAPSGDEDAPRAVGEHLGERADPAAVTDTFTLLSNETRVRILAALADSDAEAVRFSDLRSRVGVTDSGQFNYHLEKLRGELVAKTDDGYALTDAGGRVADLL